MIIKKNIISIWIVAHLLFIPGLKTLDVIPDATQHICSISIDDVEKVKKFVKYNHRLQTHCENCNFFFDHDTNLISTIQSKLHYVNASVNSTPNIYFLKDKKTIFISSRAPPNLT